MYDILITNGTIFDGSGGPSFGAAIGIKGERIVAIIPHGTATPQTATRVIDATGRYITPGFIDIHTHTDISLLVNSRMESTIHDGVTTEIGGNCGLDIALAGEGPAFSLERRFATGNESGTLIWEKPADYFELVKQQGIAANYIPLVGHNTLRKRVMGMEARPPSAAELEQMQAILAESFTLGVWGFSTGLEYAPGSAAGLDELVALSRVAAKHGGFYATHLRNEGDYLIESVQEAITICERAGLPLQLSHHKAENRENWGKNERTLAMVDDYRARGMDILLDQYPYTAFNTGLSVMLLPTWAQLGGSDEIMARLQDPETRARVEHDILKLRPRWGSSGPESGWEGIVISTCKNRREIQGHSIAELAKDAGKQPLAYALDLLVEQETAISAIHFAMSEDDVRTIMRYPHTMIGSDGVSASPTGPMAEAKGHPRTYGTFARVLSRYVRETGTLTWEQAIYKMTGLPAKRLNLPERGLLREGYHADITIFDPESVEDCATFQDPHQFSQGFDYVLVNGAVTLDRGKHTGTLAGKVLFR